MHQGNRATIVISTSNRVLKAVTAFCCLGTGCPSALGQTRKGKTEKKSKPPSILPSVALLWHHKPDQTRTLKTTAVLPLPRGLYTLELLYNP